MGETPGPIPNPEAKTHSADGTAHGSVWESRTPPDHFWSRAPPVLVGPEHFNNTFVLAALLPDQEVCDTVLMDEHLFLDPLAAEPAAAPPPVSPAPRAAAPEELTRHVDIPLAQDRAIEAFTEFPHLWWPVELRCTGTEGHLEFSGGELVEEGTDGTAHVWASIESVAPGELVLMWRGRPGQDSTEATVRVRFDSNDGQERTAVTFESDQPAAEELWSTLFVGFARFTGGSNL